MFIDLAIAAATVTIAGVVVGFITQVVQKTLAAVLTLERDLNRISSNLQKLAIRLSHIERYMERNTDFIGTALETGITEDRY